jgi:plasmid stabilization system protein ParE
MPIAVWSPKAEYDLEEILISIRVASEMPLTARRIGEEIVEAVNDQANSPNDGARYFAAPSDWRYFRHKRWLIFFQPHALGIEVMRVVDGARDLPRALAERSRPE